jgi:hypothetical protein
VLISKELSQYVVHLMYSVEDSTPMSESGRVMDLSYMKKVQKGDISCPKIHNIEERRRI